MKREEIKLASIGYAESLNGSIYDYHTKLCFVAGAEFILNKINALEFPKVEFQVWLSDNADINLFNGPDRKDAAYWGWHQALKQLRGE